MADPDIPIASAIPLPPPVNPEILQTGGALQQGGRSSFLTLPPDGGVANSTAIAELTKQGFTKGLAEAVQRSKRAFQLCIWIVDNSGSMENVDGHRIVQSKDKLKLVECTRWAEMQQTVEYHALMAAQLQAPTVFRLLNDPGRAVGEQQFSIAQRGFLHIDHEIAVAKRTMENACPGGATPLAPHLEDVHNNVLALEPELRTNGTKVVVVLATDGLPTNNRGISDASVKQQFVESLKALEGLPVWIVVRLCTDDEEVVHFWNSLDAQLELSLEVLDDFVSEAEEIHLHNPWLNYGLPLHRMREMGFHHRLFDLVDERKLSKSEIRDFFRLLLGEDSMDGVPDPEEDWNGFYNRVSKLLSKEQKTWNPITKQTEPWVDMDRVKKDYGGGGGWFFF